MAIRTRSRRQVVRHLHREEAGLLGLAALVVLVAMAGLAGQLTAMITGRGWPSWRGRGITPALEAYAHPGTPMSTWPGLPVGDPPSPVAFWMTFTVLIGLVATAAVAVARLIWRVGSSPGFASRRDVTRRLGATALVKQAPRLRPRLVQTTARPSPLQLGTSLGRDVHTSVPCFSSVRQSKFVVGPSESGKTSAVVIPEALDHDGPLIAPSSRADVMAATWKHRADRGRVLLFDPLQQAAALPLLRWDPVRACSDPTVAMRRGQALMSSVDMTGVDNGTVWKNRGQAVLRNLLHAAALSHQDIRTVLRWTFDQTSVEPAAILQRSPLTRTTGPTCNIVWPPCPNGNAPATTWP